MSIDFSTLRAVNLAADVETFVARADRSLDSLVAAPRTYDATLEVLDNLTIELDVATSLLANLEALVGDDDYRTAFETANTRAADFFARLSSSPELHATLDDFAGTAEARALDPIRARFLETTLASLRRCGAKLDASDRARLAAIEVELATLGQRFADNVVDSTKPELQTSAYVSAMTDDDDRRARETLYRSYVTLGVELGNADLAQRMLALRHEYARLLAFETYADYATDDRMLRGRTSALAFVDNLTARLQPAFRRENDSLLAFARAHGHGDELAAWDVMYWAERQRKALFDVDVESLRSLLPLEAVLRSAFDFLAKTFGLVVVRDRTASAWHPDVTSWRLCDSLGRQLGVFQLDLSAREGKRDGAWMSPVIDRMPATGGAAMLVASFGETLRPSEVEMLFHELGHLVHHFSSEVPVRSLSGIRVSTDFVELPSTLCELLATSASPLPAEAKEALRRARTFRAANDLLRQLGHAKVDLVLHSKPPPADAATLLARARAIMEPFSPAPLPDGYASIASFTHVFAAPHGYAAGFYAYPWAEVLAEDALAAAFREDSFGERLRRTVLSRGNAQEPTKLFHELVGRAPSVDALLRARGLDAVSQRPETRRRGRRSS